jgi:hypothetical protein
VTRRPCRLLQVGKDDDGTWSWFCRRCRRRESGLNRPRALRRAEEHLDVHETFGLRPLREVSSC